METKLERFTHGLVVINPANDTPEERSVVHFVGFWSEPTESDIQSLREELKTDENFGLIEIADTLLIEPSPQEAIDYMNHMLFDEPTEETIQDRWDHLTKEEQIKYKHLLPTVSKDFLSNMDNSRAWKEGDIALNGEGLVHLVIK